MASGSRRPPSFPPGSNLSDYYRVEGLWRLAEGRMFYLVNDGRPDRGGRRCWECGDEENAIDATACRTCRAALETRRFLVSTRWEKPGFDPYMAFFNKQVTHPALVTPCDVFPWPDENPVQLCSVVPYNGEHLMLDEAAPFPVARLVDFAQRAVGLLALLSHQGVRLNWLHRSNFLVRPEGDFVLFDPDVAEVQEGPLGPRDTADAIRQLGELLRRYTPVEATGWQDFFAEVSEGMFETPLELGRALQIEAQRQTGRDAPSTLHAGMTDVGLHRMLNEDNWGWSRLADGIDLFVVADGMGGHDCGEVASMLAVQTLISSARTRLKGARPDVDGLETLFSDACQEANNTIKANAEQRGNDMGTTLVACMLVDERVALCANVGDSRGYLVRDGALHQVTKDHSLVARMVEQNRITAEEARHHPHSNILLRTVGTDYDVDIDIFNLELEPGDRILLCSDGLWGEVEDAEIEAILNHYANDSRAACRELVRAAHHGGGKDNVTVLIIGVPVG